MEELFCKCQCIQDKIQIWKHIGEGKTEEPREKPLGAKERTNHKLSPHMAQMSGFEPTKHWWEASAFTTAFS